MSRNHLPSIFPWKKEHSKRRTVSRVSQEDIVKRVKSEGRPELKEIVSTRDGTVNLVRHPEYSVSHSIDACSSVEENVAHLSHLKSDLEQLKTEGKEFRNNLEELKLRLKRLQDELKNDR